ncbi:MAG TPA: DEAD/DEAH box helicase [Spirochaetota bacterium]|nr:DEAD/DEAH box helicase [Spirochaetota bacterium]HPI89593.1 DEAD/DEAH box helicase [Spirochaetota bacterium]HPR48052.1 DEAD/DEAH box helicase [Spirochaetota bacterium]
MDKFRAFLESKFSREIRSHLTMNKRDGEYSAFPDTLQQPLADVLRADGISSLYRHQVQAFDSISRNRNTLLVSQTASGKTLSFFLPILNEYIQSGQGFTVLLLYPTKALSRDQEGTFGRLMDVVRAGASLGTYDGDTPREERNRIQSGADFIISNPDMLHSGILPNHNRKWRTFLSRLRYIVVDEVHMYRGAFGSHVSNVFRRLIRVCAVHGSSPVFVCSSATVGNPGGHVRALFHREFNIIQRDHSPRPERHFYFINPPLVRSEGHALYRKGPGSVSVPLIREAVRRGIGTICFCRARQEAERLYRSVIDGRPDLAEFVKPYRGGLLPAERRGLERALASGKLRCVITTNALEVGIDIGTLDLCILSGHPGTIASFWQQAGRAGRRGKSSLTVYLARENPIDQYLVHHPEFVASAPVEQALLNADNPYILLQHLPCMAHEYPLRETEEHIGSAVYAEALGLLRHNRTLLPYRDAFRYALQDYPARGVNLRGMTDYNVDIYCGSEVIGEIDPIGARGTLYKDAIYQHLGRRYLSLDLDLGRKLCRVEPVDVDYYTEAVWESRIVMTEKDAEKEVKNALVSFGSINVNRQPKLYKKIRERTYENIGYGPITLPPFEYDTTGFSLVAPRAWTAAMISADKRFIGAAFYGLSYLLHHAAPLLCMADIKDIDTDVSLIEEENGAWKSALFLFDAIEGGVGYSEKIYDSLESALALCGSVVGECECGSGCPSCVPPLPPGVASADVEGLLIESDAARVCAVSLIKALLHGTVAVPEIKFREIPVEYCEGDENYDRERVDLHKKLDRASKILEKKRERLH